MAVGVLILLVGAVSVSAAYPFGSLSIMPAAVAPIRTGGTLILSAMSKGLFGKPEPGAEMAWSSSLPAVAWVDARTGFVRAVAPGTATISARDGLRHAELTVTVTADSVSLPVSALVGSSEVGADVTMLVSTTSRFPISRYVYGMNAVAEAEWFPPEAAPWYGAIPPDGVTLNRFGGDRLPAYNWETNYSNAGAGYNFQNDQYLSESLVPGAAVQKRAAITFQRNPDAAMLLTIPMLGFVARDACGCNVGTDHAGLAARLGMHFVPSKPAKDGPLSLTPDTSDDAVYQDEFVNWAVSTFPGKTLFFSLDNEPDAWHGTHKELRPDVGDRSDSPRLETYDGFIETSIDYARAVKRVAPQSLVFGPAMANWAGLATLGRYPSPDPVYGKKFFLEVYLDKMKQAEATYGQRLLDVLDVHWYPEASVGGQAIASDRAVQDPVVESGRMQAPRSLWDPTYREESWVADAAGGPVRLLPRLREMIAAHYPGTKLAVTEYYFGRAGDISGGIAQADALGIFGRERVFAAAFWPLADPFASGNNGSGPKAYSYAFGAFRMFLDYDGHGGRFGDTGL